jgi:hypothetical protein
VGAANEVQLGGIAEMTQDRIEESRGAHPTYQFWQYTRELLPIITETLDIGTAISGEPEILVGSLPLAANSYVQTLPGQLVAILSVAVPNTATVRKTTLWDLDRFQWGWEQTAAQTSFTAVNGLGPYWFPLGLNQFGIFPMVSSPVLATITGIAIPVPFAPPYDGTETIPFQQEYADGFADAAACIARLKEAGPDFLESLASFDAFIEKMVQLSRFGWRKGAIRFSRALGVQGRITDVKER